MSCTLFGVILLEAALQRNAWKQKKRIIKVLISQPLYYGFLSQIVGELLFSIFYIVAPR